MHGKVLTQIGWGMTVGRRAAGWLLGGAALALLSGAITGPAHAADALPSDGPALAKAFGARVGVSAMSMSPDGTHVSFLMPDGDGQKVMVADLVAGGAPRAILASNRVDEKIRNCTWPTSQRLFCRVEVYADKAGIPFSFVRMLALDADGKHLGRSMPTRQAYRSVLSACWLWMPMASTWALFPSSRATAPWVLTTMAVR